jgi:DNA-binding response OmpR family regulator
MSADQPVIYADQDTLSRELVAKALGDAGFQVVTAESGTLAFEALSKAVSPIRAIIANVDLGNGPDGWAVAKRARDLDPRVPVIYVTAGSPRPWRTEGVPMSLMIIKPFAPAELLRTLRVLLEKPENAGRTVEY